MGALGACWGFFLLKPHRCSRSQPGSWRKSRTGSSTRSNCSWEASSLCTQQHHAEVEHSPCLLCKWGWLTTMVLCSVFCLAVVTVRNYKHQHYGFWYWCQKAEQSEAVPPLPFWFKMLQPKTKKIFFFSSVPHKPWWKRKIMDLTALCLERLSELALDGYKMPPPPELWWGTPPVYSSLVPADFFFPLFFFFFFFLFFSFTRLHSRHFFWHRHPLSWSHVKIPPLRNGAFHKAPAQLPSLRKTSRTFTEKVREGQVCLFASRLGMLLTARTTAHLEKSWQGKCQQVVSKSSFWIQRCQGNLCCTQGSSSSWWHLHRGRGCRGAAAASPLTASSDDSSCLPPVFRLFCTNKHLYRTLLLKLLSFEISPLKKVAGRWIRPPLEQGAGVSTSLFKHLRQKTAHEYL